MKNSKIITFTQQKVDTHLLTINQIKGDGEIPSKYKLLEELSIKLFDDLNQKQNIEDIISQFSELIKTRFKWVVYLLKCSDNTIYTGSTNDLYKRIQKHNNKKGAKYTRTRTPVVLLKYFLCNSKSEALKLELKIKKMSHLEKIEL